MLSAASTYSFKMEFFEEDFTGRMAWNVLGKRILRAAAQHAEDRGFEKICINGRTYLWVLSRMVIEMDRMPQTGDDGSITTWLRSAYRYFTDRCFEISDSEGNVYGRVLTIWALIDAESREAVDLKDVLGDTLCDYIDAERPLSIERGARIRPNDMQPVAERQVYYSDLDKNGHLNSIRYIDYVLDTFPKWAYETQSPRRIEIAYSHESYYGDTVSILRKEAAPGAYHFAVNNQDKTACLCAVTF